MTREIKFRAWDKKKNEWLFGYEMPNLGGFSLIGEIVLMGELNSIPLQDWNHIEIMQYTGLKDKNGVEIYEGDILQEDKKNGKPFIVEWVSMTDHSYWHSSSGDVFEIIGNIYENPELLINQ